MLKTSTEKCKRWRKNHREKYLAWHRRYYKNNSQKIRAYAKSKRSEWVYGITLEEVNELRDQQNGVCPICRLPLKSEQRIIIDHNHKTGHVRGILHQKCNTILGYIEKNPTIFVSAGLYLKEDKDVERKSESEVGNG